MVTAITILSVLLACLTAFSVYSFRVINRLSSELDYQDNIIEAKNDALKYYLEDYQDLLDTYEEKVDELTALKSSMQVKKPLGRPKGSKNKVTKPKFSQKEFDKKYGK
jgi:hypothetical protein